MTMPFLEPDDEFNQELLSNAHPPQWQNPKPSGVYNLVVIGGGTAGIISALGTAGLGGRVALIERHLLGGDCLNYGCVPSKALLRCSRAIYDAQHAGEFGVGISGSIGVDFPSIMQRLRSLRAKISHHDSAQRFTSLGVDVYLGGAKFVDSHGIEVGGQRLDFRRCIIATGARAAKPQITGLEEVGYLTNETLFSLTHLPQRLLVIGGGPIGCEMAQAFRRFGSEVTILQRASELLPQEDLEASRIIRAQFEREGIRLVLGANVLRAESAEGNKRLVVTHEGREESFDGDAILVAVGRTPNTDGLQLDAAGVKFNEQGVNVDAYLRTSHPHIYGAGDIADTDSKFTHAADAMARICIQNAFFFGRKRWGDLVMPRTTYTDPEVAFVQRADQKSRQAALGIETYREEFSRVDRAMLDGETLGFAKVNCVQRTGQLVSGTIVARHAGEMIGELSLLMTKKLSLGALSSTIHCYPTQVEVLKRLGDQYNKTRLTPFVAKLLKWILRRR